VGLENPDAKPMIQDCVILHVKTTKALPWASLAEGWPASGSSDLPSVDALHRAYVERFDTFRDPEHGERVKSAVHAVAARADAGEPVSWDGLRAIQAVVTGQESVGFRTEAAYANSRMETYGASPKLEPAFARKIAHDDGETLHPLLKACRLYLDVRFFHPFARGNSAAARLAFQWVAQREGVRVPELTPLFRLPISPGDRTDYEALIESAGALLAKGP
jgi:hypothetical protein